MAADPHTSLRNAAEDNRGQLQQLAVVVAWVLVVEEAAELRKEVVAGVVQMWRHITVVEGFRICPIYRCPLRLEAFK